MEAGQILPHFRMHKSVRDGQAREGVGGSCGGIHGANRRERLGEPDQCSAGSRKSSGETNAAEVSIPTCFPDPREKAAAK
jgi:hypothetical protein